MNNVSFTGINNIKMGIGKNIVKEFGSYPSITGEIKQGEKQYRDYKLCFNLKNDSSKADFDDFLDSMARSQIGFRTNYFPGEPNKIELLMRRYEVEDDIKDTSYSLFKLNGEPIPITSRAVLSLYTKLAELTRRIIKSPNISNKQKELAQLYNQSIAQEAERFIEIM